MQEFGEGLLREPVRMYLSFNCLFFSLCQISCSFFISNFPSFSPFFSLSLLPLQCILWIKWRTYLKIHLWNSFLWNDASNFWFYLLSRQNQAFVQVFVMFGSSAKGNWHFFSLFVAPFSQPADGYTVYTRNVQQLTS